MKITKERLNQIIAEEIQNEINLKKLGAGLGAAALIGGAGSGMAKHASKMDADLEHYSSLKPVPTRYLEEIYEKATGNAFTADNVQSGKDYRDKLKFAVAELMEDGTIKHIEDKLVTNKGSVPDHGNK
jgi:hypothetical protein